MRDPERPPDPSDPSEAFRPTSRPPYDVAQYAREATARVPRAPPAPSSTALLAEIDASWTEPLGVADRSAIPVVTPLAAAARDVSHAAAFLFFHVDGVSTLEEIVRVSALPDPAPLVRELVARGLVCLEPGPFVEPAPRRSTIRPARGVARGGVGS